MTLALSMSPTELMIVIVVVLVGPLLLPYIPEMIVLTLKACRSIKRLLFGQEPKD